MLPPTRVLAGYCDALSTPRPLGPLFDMVTGTGNDIERLINNGASRNALFPAVLTEIKKSSALVVVEDAHWADEATLDLLRYLGRRVDQCPALVLVTYRDDETGRDHPVTLLLGDLATAPAVRRMTIRPLSEKAVAALAGDREIDIGELYRKTGGNPFYVTEILSAGGSGVPATVRDAVLARVNRLSAAAGATLGVAAVIGPAIESWLLAEVAGEPRAIDECIASGMLVVAGDGRYAFRHELAREAIAGATPVERLRSHHHKVLLALEEQDNAETYLVRLAYHAEAIGDAERVLRYGRDAAEQARSVSAHREAAAQLLRAHRFSSHLPNVERAILLESLAFECHAISSLQQGVEARDAAIQLWRAEGDQLRVAENLSRKASMLVLASRNSEAEEASAMALEIIRELPEHPIHGMVYRVRGNLRMLNRDTTEAVEWGERAIAVGERFGDLEVVLAAEDAIGAALLVAVQVEEGTWRLERNFENAMKAGLDSVAASSINNLGSGAGEVHEFRIARGYLDRAIKYSRERDQDMGRLYSESWLALCQLHLGEWQAAGESALAVLREMNAPGIARTMALIALGRLRTRRGDPGVWESLDEALALAEPTRTLQRIAPVGGSR